MRILSLSKNRFEGSVTLDKLPEATYFVELQGNQFQQEVIRLRRSSRKTQFLAVEKESFTKITDENGIDCTWEVKDDSRVVVRV
eukprot:CAMPEP_0201520844 /NCGR_PEP_ID=MMETSP0161_2-20130828/12910_1 /ASSEMBLY_ACC=CAM_ASM_000251 /TAXON_ID=180227 /ORGANISM="Neoparamoeba aestuarina, Strain SoJaBio B1-5/56/2" /LENGTH=83 /DNA_ID=CAMNT_0047919351 /DNA_START=155 /DNA_END=406 /DNA_ORIENTATION=+